MPFIIPNQTSYIKQRPVTPPTAWVRPADWISITDTAGEVQFLVCDVWPTYSIQTQFTQTGGVGNIYIDWGDGTTSTVSATSTTVTTRTLTTGGTPCSRGYNTWKVRVYGDSGTRITECRIIKTVGSNISNNYPNGVLEAYYGNTTVLSMSEYFRGNLAANCQYQMLEYVKCPSVLTDASPMAFAFLNCNNLAQVVMPTSTPNATSGYDGTFYGCSNLRGTITIPQDAVNINSISQLFLGCSSLTGAVLPPTLNSVTTVSQAFSGCYLLTQIQVPALPVCTTYTSMFETCYSLITIDASGLFSYNGAMAIGYMFSSCSSLEYIKLPTTLGASHSFTGPGVFSSCAGLKSVIFPSTWNTSTLASYFQNDYSLSSVTLPTSMPNLTSLANTFQSCTNLQEITLPTTVGATMTMNNAFYFCTTLSSITIPSGWVVTGSLNLAFAYCYGLASISLPSGTTGITNMANIATNCYNLVSVSIPSAAMTGVTTLANAFQGCNRLTSPPTFPSAMNSCTTMSSAFLNCYALTSVTLPTSMSACTVFNGTFSSCWSLVSITLPATVSALCNYSQLAQSCYSVKTITMPTTQTTGASLAGSFIKDCFALTTLDNEEFIGSTSTSGTLVDFSTCTGAAKLTSIRLSPRISKLTLNGTATLSSALNSVRLLNTGTGQYTGTSPQIDVSYCSMDATALNQMFTDMPSVTGKTCVVTGNPGAGTCNTAIATAKGWTVTT